jgi:N-acetyl-gamma-glutamylphosphate reductase
MSLHSPRVAVVGATGAVGAELIGCLERRGFPLSQLRLFASARSAGKSLPFRGRSLAVEPLDEQSLAGTDIALFSAGGSISRQFAPAAAAAGTVIIDNSSAFRMHDDVPLVVPEINAGELQSSPGIIANPNCVAILSVMPLWPLHREFGLQRVIASTYQAASGAGAAARRRAAFPRPDEKGRRFGRPFRFASRRSYFLAIAVSSRATVAAWRAVPPPAPPRAGAAAAPSAPAAAAAAAFAAANAACA